MPNNILITPGSASIQFSGSAANTIRLQVEQSGSVAFYGNSGSLFSITDVLSGSLMSVNDISGLPILEVFSDDRVVMGTYNQNTLVVTGSRVGIGVAAPSSTVKLHVSGAVSASSYLGDTAAIIYVIDGGGSAITTGVKGDLVIPFGCTITQWTLLADQVGSIVIDIWKDTYANYPPTVGDSITAAAKPTLSSVTNNQSSTLTGWTATITSGDTLRFNVDSVSTVTRVTLTLKVTKV